VVVGRTGGTMFFPPLRQRLRRMVAQRGRGLVRAMLDRAQAALRAHVEAVDRLAGEGRGLLRDIDGMAVALASRDEGEAEVRRLFAEGAPAVSPTPLEAVGRRPVFD